MGKGPLLAGVVMESGAEVSALPEPEASSSAVFTGRVTEVVTARVGLGAGDSGFVLVETFLAGGEEGASGMGGETTLNADRIIVSELTEANRRTEV